MNIIKKIKKIVLDTLFPIACLGCRKDGFWLCEKCFQEIPLRRDQVCPECEREITLSGFLCNPCRTSRKSPLDGLVSATFYDNPAVKKMIYNLKYRFAAGFSDPLARLAIKALYSQNIPIPSAIVPVPLHPRRLRWRGFNQALLLAENISQNLAPSFEIPVLDILERRKYNKPQMEIGNYQERLQNVRDLFRIKSDFGSIFLEGKIIFLVDDIATTGATLKECAKVLKYAGAKKVIAVVVARQALK